MKKIISILAALTLLVSMLAVNVSAASDIEFSVSDAEGKPGDIVEIEVSVDKNAGTWGMSFQIVFDSRCFDLIAVENGEVYSDGEHEDGLIDDSGIYNYYAEGSGFDANTNIGVIATLQLKILKAAPNGDYDVTIKFPDDPSGYFFALEDMDDIANSGYIHPSVEMVKKGTITVTGSDAEPLPETTVPETTVKEPAVTTKPGQNSGSVGNGYVTEIITEFVTDAEGEIVTDTDGEPVVTEVPIAVPEKTPISTDEDTTEKNKEPETEIVYVTDAEGEQVTEANGEPVTEIVIIDDGGDDSLSTVVLVICIIAIAAAAALISFVVISRRKNNEVSDDDNGADNNRKN